MQVWTFLLLFVVQRAWASQLCDKDKGPTGSIDCLQFNGYHGQYQWGTCMTLARIQEKSAHDFVAICGDHARNYCWYQCMVEVYGRIPPDVDEVTGNCACNPYHNTSVMPQQCLYPSGKSCYWYRNCFEVKHPDCKPSGNAYVIRYAERFCAVVGELENKLQGWSRWIEAVRKCLQVAIVPLLNYSEPLTCNEIRKHALASYSQCYLNPGVSSICNLPCWQYFKIFWTIKQTFLKLDTAWESFKGLWDIHTKCPSPSTHENCYEENLKAKFLKLNVKSLGQRKRRSPDPLSNVDILNRLADGIGRAIASALGWNTDVMDWLAYIKDWVGLGNLDIIIAMADKKALGIRTGPIAPANLAQTIEDFASAVEKGNLRLQVDGHNVWIKSLALCSNKTCKTTHTLAIASKHPRNDACQISHNIIRLSAVIAMLIFITDELLF